VIIFPNRMKMTGLISVWSLEQSWLQLLIAADGLKIVTLSFYNSSDVF